MSGPDLRIPAGDGTPQLDIHVNLIYDPYHYLVREGMKETSHRSEVMVHAVEWAGSECEPPGVHGLWDQWEVPMASGATLGEAVTGLRSRMNHAVDTVATALQEAETEYRERVWPRRRPAFEMALLTLDEVLAPYIVEMARHQGEVLGLTWPERIDAYLAADYYDWRGAYSHPLTIDVTENTGPTLCEIFVHEATHVADVQTTSPGQRSLNCARFRAEALPHGTHRLAEHGAVVPDYVHSESASQSAIAVRQRSRMGKWVGQVRLSVMIPRICSASGLPRTQRRAGRRSATAVFMS